MIASSAATASRRLLVRPYSDMIQAMSPSGVPDTFGIDAPLLFERFVRVVLATGSS